MIFEIHAEKNKDDTMTFLYDNMTNTLSNKETGFVYEYPDIPAETRTPVVPFDKNTPLKKSKAVTLLKIQMGLSCNYTCDYCSQKFVERAPETSRKDIDDFLEKLDHLEFDEEKGLRVEFWGGEPLVYWKTLRPLAEALREKFDWGPGREPVFTMITNGSILTKEMSMWLNFMGFNVAISHDGPGQSVRGPDPFEDPDKKKIILDFYKTMRRNGRISFNAMLNAKNKSRKDIHDWFVELTNDPYVALGEGGIVDAYDEDGITNSLQSKEEHFDFRRTAFNDIYSTDGKIGFRNQIDKIDSFTKNLLSHKNAMYLGQKCGMDLENVISVDLRGNVITCQNVSAVETGPNGESHLGGNITDMDNVEIKAATHWMNRKECPSCPVLHLCKGACMFLDKKFWEISCGNSYSDNIVMFALSIAKITGYIPVTIKGDGLPLDREDIWGTVYEHEETPKRKIIPIKVVAEKVAVIDDVEVYGKSRVEAE